MRYQRERGGESGGGGWRQDTEESLQQSFHGCCSLYSRVYIATQTTLISFHCAGEILRSLVPDGEWASGNWQNATSGHSQCAICKRTLS